MAVIIEPSYIEKIEKQNPDLLQTYMFFDDIDDVKLDFAENEFPEIAYIRNEIENLENRNAETKLIIGNLKKELEALRDKQKDYLIKKELQGLSKNEYAELLNIPNDINSVILSISTNEMQLFAINESIQIKEKELKAKQREFAIIFAKNKLVELSEKHKRAIKISKQLATELKQIEQINRTLVNLRLMPVGTAKPDYTSNLSELLGITNIYLDKSINYVKKFSSLIDNKYFA